MYAPASGTGNFSPVNFSPSSTTVRSVNSIAVGFALARIMLRTPEIPVERSGNGTTTESDFSGLGTSFRMHFVMTARVPSEPITICLSESPLASLTFLVPAVTILPSASTSSRPRT